MSSELIKIIESQQETIAKLTKMLEERVKVGYVPPDPFKPNFELFKYGNMKSTCGYQPLAGSGYGLGNPPQQE